jgi:hypothetical protein
VADAVTEFDVLPHILAKKVGNPLALMVTVICGLDDDGKLQFMFCIAAGFPAIVFFWVTADACTFAAAGKPGPPLWHTSPGVTTEVGVDVKPEVANILAPATAAALATLCASLRATYKVTTSMANAAIASRAINAIATRMIVWPCSFLRAGRILMRMVCCLNFGSA